LKGFEALSRGAASLISIEESRRMVEAIRANVKRLGFEDVAEVIAGDARKALGVLSPGEADIIFADPPYKANLPEPILQTVSDGELLSADGVLAIEHADDRKLPEETSSLVQYDRRKYGQTAVSFYRRK
jgi:16S rRNA (guanine(966)-N(2))-methyltransferase RsmD